VSDGLAEMEAAHRIAAEVAGELSLAIGRRVFSRAKATSWVRRLREVADRIEARTTQEQSHA
jgi:hypothetical protein